MPKEVQKHRFYEDYFLPPTSIEECISLKQLSQTKVQLKRLAQITWQKRSYRIYNPYTI